MRLRALSSTGGREPVARVLEDHLREEARHDDAFAEIAETRLEAFALGERESHLRVPRAGRRGQREAATEAWVDVRHLQFTRGLAEALDVCRADDPQRVGVVG